MSDSAVAERGSAAIVGGPVAVGYVPLGVFLPWVDKIVPSILMVDGSGWWVVL